MQIKFGRKFEINFNVIFEYIALDSIMSLMYKTILRRLFYPGDSNISQVNHYTHRIKSWQSKYKTAIIIYLWLGV
jgi:hypothetical protein